MSVPGPIQATIVTGTTPKPNQLLMQLALYGPDGSPHVVATQAAAQSDAPALTASAAAGATPTDAEYDALLADVTALRTTVNSLLAKLRTAEVIDT